MFLKSHNNVSSCSGEIIEEKTRTLAQGYFLSDLHVQLGKIYPIIFALWAQKTHLQQFRCIVTIVEELDSISCHCWIKQLNPTHSLYLWLARTAQYVKQCQATNPFITPVLWSLYRNDPTCKIVPINGYNLSHLPFSEYYLVRKTESTVLYLLFG